MDNLTEVNWGIIGCGDVCERKSGPAFYQVEHSRLVAVMRRDGEKAREFARRHQAPKYYTDAEELIHDPDVNAIYVAIPPDTHLFYTVKALRAGKPVYVEKPMAMDYRECLEMVRVSRETGVKLFVAFPRRCIDYFLKIRELLAEEKIGTVLSVEVRLVRPPQETDKDPATHTWRVKKEIAGGGYFYDMAPHTLDVLDFLLGEIAEAKGYTANRGNWHEVEDLVSAAFRFTSGVVGTGLWCYTSDETQREDSVEITGTRGRISFSSFTYTPIRVVTSQGIETYPIPAPAFSQWQIIERVVAELRGTGTCPSTGESSLRTAKILEQIYQG
ncbi:MAG: Gfo/Idh/MocA family oxidoreductase [Tannerellaceae bacterium]|nr:Gfo/Idh/MocA family oxidoreductase [Tannerellaceae bacterium]